LLIKKELRKIQKQFPQFDIQHEIDEGSMGESILKILIFYKDIEMYSVDGCEREFLSENFKPEILIKELKYISAYLKIFERLKICFPNLEIKPCWSSSSGPKWNTLQLEISENTSPFYCAICFGISFSSCIKDYYFDLMLDISTVFIKRRVNNFHVTTNDVVSAYYLDKTLIYLKDLENNVIRNVKEVRTLIDSFCLGILTKGKS
jgi:hypothetical protein